MTRFQTNAFWASILLFGVIAWLLWAKQYEPAVMLAAYLAGVATRFSRDKRMKHGKSRRKSKRVQEKTRS